MHTKIMLFMIFTLGLYPSLGLWPSLHGEQRVRLRNVLMPAFCLQLPIARFQTVSKKQPKITNESTDLRKIFLDR